MSQKIFSTCLLLGHLSNNQPQLDWDTTGWFFPLDIITTNQGTMANSGFPIHFWPCPVWVSEVLLILHFMCIFLYDVLCSFRFALPYLILRPLYLHASYHIQLRKVLLASVLFSDMVLNLQYGFIAWLLSTCVGLLLSFLRYSYGLLSSVFWANQHPLIYFYCLRIYYRVGVACMPLFDEWDMACYML